MLSIEKKSNQLLWGGSDAFTHTLVVGPTRCGKTALILKPIIFQILEQRAKGIPAGMTVIEPKGDVVRDVKEICDELGVEYHYIDPLYPDESEAINVMKGPKIDIAEATVAVLKSMFGKQEAFFQYIQELSARKITLLLKTLYGDDVFLIDVLKNLRDEATLKRNVERLRMKNVDPDLVDFFDNELLKGKDAEKFRSLVLGLRAQLDNLMSNEYLQPLISRQSNMDLDEHFEKGGILAVNTALGKLGRAGDAFGQFVAMHMQLATFRRPGTEDTRIPHYLIIDEYSRYINPDVERFLSIAAEYRVAGIFAVQSLGQLEVESGLTNAQAMKKAILTSCRNKIFFGGLSGQDAKEASVELGMDTVKQTEKRYDGSILRQLQPKMTSDREVEKERFNYTTIMDGIPRFHFIHKLVIDGTSQPPGLAVGKFIPRDPKKLREHFRKIKAENDLKAKREELLKQEVPKWKILNYIEYRKKLALLEKKIEEQEQSSSVIENPKTYQLFDSSQGSDVLKEEKNEQNESNVPEKEFEDKVEGSVAVTEKTEQSEENSTDSVVFKDVKEVEDTTNSDTNIIEKENVNMNEKEEEIESDSKDVSGYGSVNTNVEVFIVEDDYDDSEDVEFEDEYVIVDETDKDNESGENKHEKEKQKVNQKKKNEERNEDGAETHQDDDDSHYPAFF